MYDIIKLAQLGYEAARQTPQVLPLANLMKPFSPHPFDQEFLMCQAYESTATKVTP